LAAQDLPTLASELRRLRLEAGLSQEALADRAGLSSDAIAALERGRRRVPRQSTLQLLADALSLDPSQRALLNTISRSSSVSLKESSSVEVAPEHRPRINADPLVGREAARKEVADLLRQSRLVTLTGPAGVGKTRLALAVAGDSQADFADGAC
jgi:transcriptional regulator with XRE-family HTH domain